MLPEHLIGKADEDDFYAAMDWLLELPTQFCAAARGVVGTYGEC
jgi:hypothetical protein